MQAGFKARRLKVAFEKIRESLSVRGGLQMSWLPVRSSQSLGSVTGFTKHRFQLSGGGGGGGGEGGGISHKQLNPASSE